MQLLAFLAILLFMLSGCGAQGPQISILREQGGYQLFVDSELVHNSVKPITNVEAFYPRQALKESVVIWREDSGGDNYRVRTERGWSEVKESDGKLRLRNSVFDPLYLPSREDHQEKPILYLIQFKTQPLASYLEDLRNRGIRVFQYVDQNAYIVQLPPHFTRFESMRLPFVRAVIPFSPSFKIAASLRHACSEQVRRLAVDVTFVDQAFEEELVGFLKTRIGKEHILGRNYSSYEVRANCRQIEDMAMLPGVQWIELAPLFIEEDQSFQRARGGADAIVGLMNGTSESFTGIGIRGHVLEGIYPEHPDFAANEYRKEPIFIDDPDPSTHGQATFGVVFGSGAGNPNAKGILPNAQGYYTNYKVIKKGDPLSKEKGTRYELVGRLVREHKVLFQTASWGYEATEEYTSRSLEMDSIIFDHDLPITQSVANHGNRMMRPQAWAKNIISVGAIYQFATLTPDDDKWWQPDTGSSSIGPAQDGRIKPDLIASYDSTLTTAVEGYMQFTGSSAATPIVAGYLGLAIEMWTDNLFNQKYQPESEDRFQNRPHASTAKALLINSAQSYRFSGEEADLTRIHQGWGYPSAERLYAQRSQTFVVNEDRVLENLETAESVFTIGKDAPELRITLVYSDPPGALINAKSQVNNLDLKVTSPDGAVYWGNHGLREGNISTEGGEPDTVDTVENVFIPSPSPGEWRVEVIAAQLSKDAHIETEALDADYALVVRGPEAQLQLTR